MSGEAADASSTTTEEVPSPPDRDLYAILGVPRTATLNDMKKAYHRAARSWFPDRPKEGEVEKFKLVTEAYEILSDSTRREIYDREGEEGVSKALKEKTIQPASEHIDWSQWFAENKECTAQVNDTPHHS